MSLPSGWTLNLQWLQKRRQAKAESQFRAASKSCQLMATQSMVKFQNENGQFNGSRWTVTDVPGNFGEDQDEVESAAFEQKIESDILSKRQAGKADGRKAVCLMANKKEYNKKEYKEK
jgi:hypothetical protein